MVACFLVALLSCTVRGLRRVVFRLLRKCHVLNGRLLQVSWTFATDEPGRSFVSWPPLVFNIRIGFLHTFFSEVRCAASRVVCLSNRYVFIPKLCGVSRVTHGLCGLSKVAVLTSWSREGGWAGTGQGAILAKFVETLRSSLEF